MARLLLGNGSKDIRACGAISVEHHVRKAGLGF